MDTLFEKSYRKVQSVSLGFTRSIMDDIRWDSRLIGIRGARGVGKTTLLLQYMKRFLPQDTSALYVSLDNIWFAEHRLLDLVDAFVKKGGRYLFVDEVHKYPSWSQELKNAYDDYPDLHLVFTGSSSLAILNACADLSRRTVAYRMQGLSFREYLNISLSESFPIFSLQDILENHHEISAEVLKKVKPLQHFDRYLETGYYPFSFEAGELYCGLLEEVVSLILEIELPRLRNVDISYVTNLKQLLLIIAESASFTPNLQTLSEHIGINRATLIAYLDYLREAHLTKHLYRDSAGVGKLQKPDKIFLENTNLAYALAAHRANLGSMRESFFFNQLEYRHKIAYPDKGDFLVDKKYTFEIGGKGKNSRQIYALENAYIAADDIEYGHENKIPLWMFGFLY
ncbi:MAG: AAA family ATPase [Prevotellaceae bacterium]|jgi:predicted AAA+ superfamily ATPase|nr:AAA family ATPase [Prevotellaceae bacterium]